MACHENEDGQSPRVKMRSKFGVLVSDLLLFHL